MKYFNDYDFLWKYFVPTSFHEFEKKSILNIIENLGVRSIMDIGCGNGELLNELKNLKTIAVDTSTKALETCKSDIKYTGGLPFLEDIKDKADIVTCLQVMEHIPKKLHKTSLTSLSSKTNKYCLISSPFLQNLRGAYVKCPRCNTAFQCEGHVISFDYFSLLHFQRYLGKLKYLYFYGIPRRFGNVVSTLKHYYDILKSNINQRLFSKYQCTPPFTKCPECNYEIFYNYETYKNINIDNKTNYYSLWDYSKNRQISSHFIAIYEKMDKK